MKIFSTAVTKEIFSFNVTVFASLHLWFTLST